MDELVRVYSEHQTRGIPVEVDAAWLHHRFTQIHPFADGNGRVARALARRVLIKRGWFPVIIKRDDPQRRYIEALEKADAGDLRPLIGIFVEAQRAALIDASEVAFDVSPITSTHDAVIAVRDRLIQKRQTATEGVGSRKGHGGATPPTSRSTARKRVARSRFRDCQPWAGIRFHRFEWADCIPGRGYQGCWDRPDFAEYESIH